MMFTELNASGYDYNDPFYNAEFEDLLAKIVVCYNLMISDNVNLSNDENIIRDALLTKYLKNNLVRKNVGLLDFLFDREVPEDNTIGRTDIKIQTINTFQDINAYYIIECKRLDAINTKGKTGLNAKYIQNGIYRFTSNNYSTYNKTNGMIGFLVQEVDIHENIASINRLLKNTFNDAKTITLISKRNFIPGFDYSYYSTHSVNNGEIAIYHLMFDFSRNIN